MRAALAGLCVLAFGCGSEDPPPSVDPPAAPDQNDPAYTVEAKAWYLVGNELTPGGDTFHAEIDGAAGFVDAWVNGAPGVRLVRDGSHFTLDADIASLAPGDYDVLFAADGSDTAFAKFTLHRSHPYYVFVSTDWDFSDPSDMANEFQDRMHAEHPGIKVTNFVGPYTFTDDTVVDDAREAELVAWVKHERDDFGDEIGLHIHPYCNFVDTTGVTCDTVDKLAPDSDNTGYTVGLFAYGHDDMLTLLQAADALFVQAGFGKPVTFRAGAWSASADTLRALADDGFVADTSALNWIHIEEWNHFGAGTLFSWNRDNWSTITDTSQPYYPNETDQQSSDEPTISMLEVPDNGVMVDYVSVDEMHTIFDENWDGTPLQQPTTFMMGFHPSANLTDADMSRVDGLLDVTDQYLAQDGNGPVVYEVLKNMPIVFSR